MGEIADMMIEGLLDYETGEYIDGKAPGYPRTVGGRPVFMGEKKEPHFEDDSHKVKGMINYLSGWSLSKEEKHNVLKEYSQYNSWDITSRNEICIKAQDNFGHFVKWFKERKYAPKISIKPLK